MRRLLREKESKPAMNEFNLQPFIRVCQIVCFILAGYMVYVQFHAYFDNQNVSSTEYRRFKDGNEEIYPTFSICAVGGLKLILRETATFFSPNQNATEYEKILKGKRYGTLDYDKIRLDQVVLDINDLITRFGTTTSDNKKITKNNQKINNQLTQTPEEKIQIQCWKSAITIPIGYVQPKPIFRQTRWWQRT